MATILQDKIIEAKKEYRCLLCGAPIKKGEKHKYVAYPNGATIDSYRVHINCSKAISDFCYECDEEEWGVSEVMELVNEKIREKGLQPADTVYDAINQLY